MFRGCVPYACAFILSTFFYVSGKISRVNEGKWQGLALGSVYDIRMEISGRRRERTQENMFHRSFSMEPLLKSCFLFMFYIMYVRMCMAWHSCGGQRTMER